MPEGNNTDSVSITVVPYDALDRDTLRTLITEFIMREGTDYGSVEVTLALKIEHVMRQLRSGSVAITYCAKSETTTLIPARQLSTITDTNFLHKNI